MVRGEPTDQKFQARESSWCNSRSADRNLKALSLCAGNLSLTHICANGTVLTLGSTLAKAAEIHNHLSTSCPRLSAPVAGTTSLRIGGRSKLVNGRTKPGHDVERALWFPPSRSNLRG